MATSGDFLVATDRATGVSIAADPASWDGTFHSWSGPGVEEKFSSAAPPEQVIAFYVSEGERLGWQLSGPVRPGLAAQWSKRFPAGDTASLGLANLGGGSADNYMVTAGRNAILQAG